MCIALVDLKRSDARAGVSGGWRKVPFWWMDDKGNIDMEVDRRSTGG